MQGFSNDAVQTLASQRRLTVQPDDRLSIVVNSKDPDLAMVFNLPVAQTRIGTNSGSGSSSNANGQVSSFIVDESGNIEYPILGTIHVGGMTRKEIAAEISRQLISNKLLSDPLVTVEFLNATISVLGDVNSPGEYPITRDNMTILQALSKAGDLNITGMRDNVLVVREEDGQDRAYRVDLTDTDNLMSSPAYYLQQNDVVYVEPNDTKKRQATANGNTLFTPAFWISVASFFITITTLILK